MGTPTLAAICRTLWWDSDSAQTSSCRVSVIQLLSHFGPVALVIDGVSASVAMSNARAITLGPDRIRSTPGNTVADILRTVPGVLLSNRPLNASLETRGANLRDLTVSILADFGIAAPAQMTGSSVF